MSRHSASAILLIGVAAGAAIAQDRGDVPPRGPNLTSWWFWQEGQRPPNPWTIQFEPTTWYLAPSGDIELPGVSILRPQYNFDLLNLDSPRASPAGEIHLRLHDWRFSVAAVTLETRNRASIAPRNAQIGQAVISEGDTTRSSLNFTIVEGTIAHRIGEARLGANACGTHELIASLEGFVGLRGYFVDLSIDVESLSPSTSPTSAHSDEHFIEPFIGARIDLELHKHFTIDLTPQFGYMTLGNDEVWSWAMSVAFQWRPVESVGLQIGFRQHGYELISDADVGRFRWRGAVGGIYGGLSLRF